MSLRRMIVLLLVFSTFVAWFALFRPTALGGPATYLVVNGESMEPAYHHGDLVVLHKTSTFEVGDVVAYPMQTYFNTGRLVIHRIVGQDELGFITRGDNRDQDDPWRATPEITRGEAWLHVPNVGTYAAWLGQPSHLAPLVVVIFLAGGVGKAQTRRRRGRRMKQLTKHPNSLGSPAAGVTHSALTGILAISGLACVALLVLGFVAFRESPTSQVQSGEPAYTQEGTFGYAFQMTPSTLYPDGVLNSPEPRPADAGEPRVPAAFAALTKEIAVDFQYVLESPDSVEMAGMVSADLVLSPRDGEWERVEPLLAPEPFEGASLSRSFVIDMPSVATLIETIEEETGLNAGSYALRIAFHIAGAGTLGREAFAPTFDSELAMTYDSTLITPSAELTTSESTASTVTAIRTNTVPLGLWAPTVETTRSIVVFGLAAALAVGVVASATMALKLRSDERARIQARYGSRLVGVEATDPPGKAAIRVATIGDLARIADRCGVVILHTPQPGGHRYFVRDGEDTFEYVSAAAQADSNDRAGVAQGAG